MDVEDGMSADNLSADTSMPRNIELQADYVLTGTSASSASGAGRPASDVWLAKARMTRMPVMTWWSSCVLLNSRYV